MSSFHYSPAVSGMSEANKVYLFIPLRIKKGEKNNHECESPGESN
jgi:hypothetical protein